MTEKEALKLALEALGCALSDDRPYIVQCKEAITAIKEALMSGTDGAQPEQLMHDQINYGMSVTQGGKRIDPMSIYKEPEQKPVAWRAGVSKFPQGTGSDWVYVTKPIMKDRIHNQPLYITPPSVAKPHKRPSRSDIKPLTDEEIILIVADCASSHQHTDIHFARAIEAAHGIIAPTELKGEA